MGARSASTAVHLPACAEPHACTHIARRAGTAAKMGKHIEVNEMLDRIRDAIRADAKVVREAFDELDSDHDGCLSNLEVVRLVRRFLNGEGEGGRLALGGGAGRAGGASSLHMALGTLMVAPGPWPKGGAIPTPLQRLSSQSCQRNGWENGR